jgi:hypothetical protein
MKRTMKVVGKPEPRKEFKFRGVAFFTKNLGAVDGFSNQFCWYASGCWTHDQADGVFSSLDAAIADRFNIWDELGFSYAEKFRSSEQLAKYKALLAEIKSEQNDQTSRD